MLLDLKAACREIWKNRWSTCVVVLTLGLGIGANTAIFGVVNKLLLNPLPYPDSDRIVYLGLNNPTVGFGLPTAKFVASAWREEARSIDALEAYTNREALASDEGGARVLGGMDVTPGLAPMLAVAPLLGRGFAPSDTDPGAPAVVLLSYEIWQRDYGGSADVLGRVVTLDEKPHVVIGVMPPRWDHFAQTARADVWFPLTLGRSAAPPGIYEFVSAVARVAPGVPIETVRSELDAVLRRALAAAPQPLFGSLEVTTRLTRPADFVGRGTRDALLVLSGAVGLVLLVACSNVANLLLARTASRARELALRAAIGASTWRLVRAQFAECLVLALAAGVAGLALGWSALRILQSVRPASLEALAEVELDPTVLAFTFAVAVATAFLFGLAPVLQLRSQNVGDALRHGASGVVRGGAGARARKLLVTAQMGISVVLLVSAGLLVRSVIYLQQVDVGFDPENLFTATLTLPRAEYQEPASREDLSQRLLARLEASPGVLAATEALIGPPYGATFVGVDFAIRGAPPDAADAGTPRWLNNVRADYFETLRIRLLEGRTFTADEDMPIIRGGGMVPADDGAVIVNSAAIIVNSAAARRYWPDGGALGGEVKWGSAWLPVVGVVDNVVVSGLTAGRDQPQFYLPFRHRPTPGNAAPPALVIIVRAEGDPATAIASLRGVVRELDPAIAVREITRTETALAGTIDAPRFNMALLIAFAVTSLVLGAVGLASVIGYEVAERTHEFGVRMALGARTESVRLLAMKRGLKPALAGVVLGVVGALAATRIAASTLYGVGPHDPLTFVTVVALLVLVALGASWLPARRATRVDPMVSLRAD